MSETEKYTVNQYTINTIMGFIKSDTIAVPEIQRPFVWQRKQVRDLIDSLYNGYPVGYIITWQNPSIRLKDGSMSENRMTMIDGQQRITAIMAAILGMEVVNENYEKVRIKIAFNPFPGPGEERFEVQDQSHLRSKKWIPDISVLFDDNYNAFDFIPKFCSANPDIQEDKLNSEIEKLRSIRNVAIGVITLKSELTIDVVTEIFVRINSKGTVLDQSDFVMSKISADTKYGGDKLRKMIEYFSHILKKPEFYELIRSKDRTFIEEHKNNLEWVSKLQNSMYMPDYKDILRVCFMYKFGRGKLSDLVNLLSGRNFETKTYEESIIESTFNSMMESVETFTNKHKFIEFTNAIRATGYEHKSLINSDMTIDFAYALYLLLSERDNIPKNKVGAYVGRWFVMSALTGRYTSSPESKMDKDLRMIDEKGFLNYLQEIESSELSDAFWNFTLVQGLETMRITNPKYLAYIAAQIYNGENSLFSKNLKISSLVCNSAGDVHHIFPKDYLKKNGMSQNQYNQVANYALIGKITNIAISNNSPEQYMSLVLKQCEDKDLRIGDITDNGMLEENLRVNCIPSSIFTADIDDYEQFLVERRKMMSDKIRDYYRVISDLC
ncbi:GmrSD restriction endonuclease domain-containing protein [Candidatus Methanarcanum hacksteinii]|uniref:GmrSD restriction endonuclease domain-containing protein n=1 Tax=Candidatus Methanarcanum hacksteinii TaxID=2911857 RepID=UPI0037DD0B3D